MANQKKITKREYGKNRKLVTLSFDQWFIRKLRGDSNAKSNRSAFVQDAVCEKMKWKAPPPLGKTKKR